VERAELSAASVPNRSGRAGDPASWAAALGWGALGAAACALVAPFEPNLLEEGILLHVAQRLARGERLYRDVLAFTGPLPFEWLALLFRAFGEEIRVARACVVILHGVATAAAFAISRRAGAGAFAHAAAGSHAAAPLLLFPLFSIYYYTTFAFHLSVLSAWAALRGLGSRRWAALAGAGVAAVALCKQPIGVALALATLAALAGCSTAGLRRQTIAAFVAGGAAVAVVTLAGLAASGTLADALHALVVLPTSLEETFDAPFVNLWPPGTLEPAIAASQTFYLPYFYMLVHGVYVEPGWRIIVTTQALFAAPIAAVILTAAARAGGPLNAAVWVHGALLLAWLSNLYPRADWGHLAHVLPLGLAQLCIVAGARAPRTARAGRAIAVAALLALLGAGSGWAVLQVALSAGPGDFGPRVRLRPVSASLQGEAVPRVIAFLRRHTEPNDPIFVARAEPLLYFATDTRNPTQYPGVIPGMRREQERTIVTALEQVRYVVMSDIDQPAMARSLTQDWRRSLGAEARRRQGAFPEGVAEPRRGGRNAVGGDASATRRPVPVLGQTPSGPPGARGPGS
jgi:hypothetical protein